MDKSSDMVMVYLGTNKVLKVVAKEYIRLLLESTRCPQSILSKKFFIEKRQI